MIKENIAEEITNLKQQTGKDMIILGSPRFAHSLMQLGLIDEYQITVHPVVLGNQRKKNDCPRRQVVSNAISRAPEADIQIRNVLGFSTT